MLFELGLATADLILSEFGLVMEDSFLSEWVGWGSSQSLWTRFYLNWVASRHCGGPHVI